MSEVRMPRHKKNSTLHFRHGRLRLALMVGRSMFDLTGQATYRIMLREMPEPGPRRNLAEVTARITNDMTLPEGGLRGHGNSKSMTPFSASSR